MDNTAVTALTMVIVAVFVVLPLSFSVFNTSQNLREQYSLLDAFYSMNSWREAPGPVVKTDSDIIIVDLSEVTDRPGVYLAMKKIMEAGPRLVGFDVWMEGRDGIPVEDSIQALLSGNPNIISPCLIEEETAPDATSFRKEKFPYYASADTPGLAAVNVDLQGASWNCRTFTPRVSCGEKKYEVLSVAMSASLDPEAHAAVMAHPDTPHYIQFSRRGYQNLSAEFIIIDTTGIAQRMLRDKIVLVGDTNDPGDLYPTPIKVRMSGVEIHANALNTILNQSWPGVMGKPAAWILAFLGVFLLLPLLRLIKKNEWLAIFSGAVQAIVIILFAFVCYLIFVRFNFYVNSIYLLLGIGFMDMAESLYRKITNK